MGYLVENQRGNTFFATKSLRVRSKIVKMSNFRKNIFLSQFFFENFSNFFDFFLKIFESCLPCIHLVLTLKCSNFFVCGPILIILKLCKGNVVKLPKKLRRLPGILLVYKLSCYSCL